MERITKYYIVLAIIGVVMTFIISHYVLNKEISQSLYNSLFVAIGYFALFHINKKFERKSEK